MGSHARYASFAIATILTPTSSSRLLPSTSTHCAFLALFYRADVGMATSCMWDGRRDGRGRAAWRAALVCWRATFVTSSCIWRGGLMPAAPRITLPCLLSHPHTLHGALPAIPIPTTTRTSTTSRHCTTAAPTRLQEVPLPHYSPPRSPPAFIPVPVFLACALTLIVAHSSTSSPSPSPQCHRDTSY